MDHRGISHTVDRTGTCRLREQELGTSRVILGPEHGIENSDYKFFNFSVFFSSHLSPKVRNRRITYQVQEYSLLRFPPLLVYTALQKLSKHRHKAREWTGGEMRENAFHYNCQCRTQSSDSILYLQSRSVTVMCDSHPTTNCGLVDGTT
jgi:hypothetical protein